MNSNKASIITLTTNELPLVCGGKNIFKKTGNVIAKFPKEVERATKNTAYFFEDAVKNINAGIKEVHHKELNEIVQNVSPGTPEVYNEEHDKEEL